MSDRFDIPDTMRDFAESGVEQARKALEDYLAVAQKAAGTLETSAANARESVRTLAADAIAFAEETMSASFDFSMRAAGARSVEEMVTLQSAFIEKRMAAFTRQAEKVAKSIAAAARPGPAGT